MAQHDFNIANATFPSVRSDINSALTAINTTQSGTSRPSSAVAGTIWLDTTSASTPTLKYYDGADDISLATLDHSANTVNWLDSTVSITGLSTTATATVLTLSDSANTTTVNLIIDNDKEVRFREATANGTNYISLSAPASVSADVTFTLPVAPTANNQALVATTAGVMSFTPYALPSADGTANQVLQTNGSGVLSFATISAGTPTVNTFDTGTGAVYTKPSTANWMLVELWGGGGSGGRSNSSGNAASGGGGGSYNYAMIPFADLVGQVTYTVGGGGAGRTTAANGNVGGTTSIFFANFQGLGTTKTISAFGGGGGRGLATGGITSCAGGGSGGTQTGAGETSTSIILIDGNGVKGADNDVGCGFREYQDTSFPATMGGGGGIEVTGTCGDVFTLKRAASSIFGGGGGGAALTSTGGAGGNSYYGGGGGSGSRTNTGGTSIWGGNGSNGAASGTVTAAGSLPAGGSAGAQNANSGNGGGGRVRFTYW